MRPPAMDMPRRVVSNAMPGAAIRPELKPILAISSHAATTARMCAVAECQQMQAGSDVSVSGRSGTRSGLHLWAIGITVIVLIMLGCGTTIWDLHRQTIEQHLIAVSNLGVVLGEQTERYVQLVDRTLEDIQSRVAELGPASPDELTMALRTEATASLLRERLANLPRNNAFNLLKADGRVLISTRAPRDMDLSDRDYFRHFATHDDLEPFISAPLQSRTLGTPTVFIARRINRSGSHLPRSCGRSHRSWVSHRLLSGDKIATRRNRHSAAKRWARAGPISRPNEPGRKMDARSVALVPACRRARRHSRYHPAFSPPSPRWSPSAQALARLAVGHRCFDEGGYSA